MKHLVAIALLAASPAWAGSFAPTTEALTRNSACGALAVGMREDGTHIKGQAADRDGGAPFLDRLLKLQYDDWLQD